MERAVHYPQINAWTAEVLMLGAGAWSWTLRDLDRMLELGYLATRRVVGDGSCGYHAYLASCPAATVPDSLLEHQPCGMRRGRRMGKEKARMEFLRRLAMGALITIEWGRKLCLKHAPASGEAKWFWDYNLCTCKLNAALVSGLRGPSESMSEQDGTENLATNPILHALGCLDRVDIVVVNALSLRDEGSFHFTANTNFSKRTVSWSRDI
eukprot:6172915-Pleurochrysis_carterae.AAC.1